jgi:hypothetical protein
MSEDNNVLLNVYNFERVPEARSLGLTNYRTLQRFRPADSGPARIAQIESDIRAAKASKAAVEREQDTAVTPTSESVVELPPVSDAMVESAVAEATGVVAAVEEDTTADTRKEDESMAKEAAVKTAVKKVVKTAVPKVKAKAVVPAKKRGRPPTNGETIAAKTGELNELYPELKKTGYPRARKYTSLFGSHTAADAQLKAARDWLKSHKNA